MKPLEAVVLGGPKGLERLLKGKVLEIKPGSVRLGFGVVSDAPIHPLKIGERIQSGGLKGKAS